MTQSEQSEVKDDSSNDEEILRIARERFSTAQEAETEMRMLQLDDQRFRAGDQWPDEVKADRAVENRPCITINKLPQFVRQITNDQRQNRPSIKVNPVDDKADVDTAKIIQGLIRHIEYNSNADTAYDTAFEGAVTKGLGYLRVITDYADPESFNQEIFIKRIRNSFSVYLDPSYHEADGSDANWAFVFENMSKDDFKAQYPKAKMSSMQDWASLGDMMEGWALESTVRVAEYFYKTFKEVDIVLLSNGQVLEKSNPALQNLPEGISIKQERTTQLPAIKWCKINGNEILEETDWLGQWIPIIPVLGDELDIDGKRILEGVIRHAKDPQRMFNYWASLETETIALAPKSPWIMAEGQDEGYENMWKTANVKNHSKLVYKPTTVAGLQVPPPQRNMSEPPVMAITQARGQSSDDMKATTGIYDAALGNRSNENSGIAIERRNSQSQTSNFHFIDNLTRSMRHLGNILVDLIPHIYDTPQMVRILGDDGVAEQVQINQVFTPKPGDDPKIYDLKIGKYDVAITTGPSYATKRQESVSSMLSLTQHYPQMAQLAGDLIVGNMDWPGAQEIAERLKKSLPPGIADDSKDGQPSIPPQAQAQISQMSNMVQELTKQLNKAMDEKDQKVLELESKERIAVMQTQANLEIELAKLGDSSAQALLKAQMVANKHRMDLLSANQSIASEALAQSQPEQAPPSQDPNAAGLQGMASPNNQQPIGGQQSPSQPMGVKP